MPLTIFFLWQHCINKKCTEDDQVSNVWSQSFFYKSAAIELHERVDSKYKDLPAHYKGGITCLFL